MDNRHQSETLSPATLLPTNAQVRAEISYLDSPTCYRECLLTPYIAAAKRSPKYTQAITEKPKSSSASGGFNWWILVYVLVLAATLVLVII